MADSFGGWDLAIMLILTKAGRFYARIDVDHQFGPGGDRQRLSIPCRVCIDWSQAGSGVDAATLEAWEREFMECVRESPGGWGALIDWIGEEPRVPKRGRGRNAKRREKTIFEESDEVDDYAELCRSQGLDPYDGEIFESYFGCEPDPDRLIGP
jgi:hypothetical protein